MTEPQARATAEPGTPPVSAQEHRPAEGRIDTTIVRAIAALVVVNSHLEHFYPVRWLAADGLLGNSLFFLLAGYGLVRSAERGLQPFPKWYWRRVLRIYPALLIAGPVFALGIERQYLVWTPLQALHELVWPTGFSFIEIIMPFYVLMYPMLAARRRWVYIAAIGVAAVVYVVAYAHDIRALPANEPLELGARTKWVHDPAYFAVFALGGWLGWSRRSFSRSFTLRAQAAIAVALVYFGAKYAMVRGHGVRAYAVLHLLVFALCYFLFVTLSDRRVVAAARSVRPLWWLLALVGGLTLEIYLVHSYVVAFDWLARLPFPLNQALFWPMMLAFAFLLGKAATWARVAIEGRPNRPALS